MSKDIAIEAKELSKTYPPDVRALDGLSLAVPAGTIFGLLGPNGAGKSTTVRILTTLSRPDAGSARVAGIDVLAHPVQVRHAIGIVAQRHGLDPEATGRENLVLQGEFHAITGADLRRRVADALERFGLAGAADRQAKTYSGGMQRRLDLAMGLIHRPQVLFLDEPTTGLDPEARADIWREIERLAREERMTILLTTHYLEEADRLASQLAIVDRGRIVAQGTPDELKSELEGDRIQIELVDDHEAAARTALAGVSGIGDAALEGRILHARARDGATAIPAVLAALDAHGVTAASVTLARPSLDDVYLRHAGRSFDRADAEHEAVAA
jgi:ABC-2 type transport system ATP-binding protein